MKTDDLVSMLATGAGAVDAKAPLRRFLPRSAAAHRSPRC